MHARCYRSIVPRHIHPELITLAVFDISGKKIETLYSAPILSGSHTFTFSTANLPDGIYFYLLKSDKKSTSGKIIVANH